MEEEIKETGCCPKFNPEPWDGKELVWDNRKFVKDKVFTLFFIPMNFGKVMARLTGKVEAANAQMPDQLCLSEQVSNFKMDIYLSVDKEVPAAENVTLSGKFLSKVYEGDFKDAGKRMKDFDSYVSSKNLKTKRTFMWYTTCPKCAKAYGKNYTVVIGQIA